MNETTGLTTGILWNDQGLVPAIAQDWQTGEVLMLAWMNEEALRLTVSEGRAIYWSRSRDTLWRKGEESGHVQHLKELRIDCDADTVLLLSRWAESPVTRGVAAVSTRSRWDRSGKSPMM